jgi:hypothetical protein
MARRQRKRLQRRRRRSTTRITSTLTVLLILFFVLIIDDVIILEVTATSNNDAVAPATDAAAARPSARRQKRSSSFLTSSFAPKTRLTWVNGIGYGIEHMERDAPMISKYFGGKKVEWYHNPTSMVDETDTKGFYRDLTQAGQQKYLGWITSEVNGLVQHLRDAVKSVSSGIVIHIAHSQGALVTCLAAKQLTSYEMNQIEVISFGGATPVRSTPETPWKRCVNYYSVNDPLLFLNPSAETALRSGFEETEFCFLAPRIGDPVADHHLLGPTYASALEWEGKRYERRYQSYIHRITRFTVLSSIAIIQTILSIISLLWTKFITVMYNIRIRRRLLIRSLILKIIAIRAWIISTITLLLTRIVSCFRGNNVFPSSPSSSDDDDASTSNELPPPLTATTKTKGSTLEESLPASPTVVKSTSLLRFISKRKKVADDTNSTQVVELENEDETSASATTATTATTATSSKPSTTSTTATAQKKTRLSVRNKFLSKKQ